MNSDNKDAPVNNIMQVNDVFDNEAANYDLLCALDEFIGSTSIVGATNKIKHIVSIFTQPKFVIRDTILPNLLNVYSYILLEYGEEMFFLLTTACTSAIDRFVDASKLDSINLLKMLLEGELYVSALKFLEKSKLTDAMLATAHDCFLKSRFFEKDKFKDDSSYKRILNYKNNIENVYKLFMNNLVYPTKVMVIEILKHFDFDYECVQYIITKKEYISIRIQECTPTHRICDKLCNLLQDDSDYRTYIACRFSHNFTITEAKKYKKNWGIKYDSKLFNECMAKSLRIDKAVIKFFVAEGAEPDADSIISLVLCSGKVKKTLMSNLKLIKPKFDYAKFKP